jgi:hypothetical protein
VTWRGRKPTTSPLSPNRNPAGAEASSGKSCERLVRVIRDRPETKWGNDLRRTFRTIATAAGVSEIDAKLLMNHAIPGVNAGYITRPKLLEDHLRSQRQAISSAVFLALRTSIAEHQALRVWLGRGASRQAMGLQMEPVDSNREQERVLQAA